MKYYRGVILRGAGIAHLWTDGLALFTMGTVLLIIAARRLQKEVIMMAWPFAWLTSPGW
jgi:hypothetical protein